MISLRAEEAKRAALVFQKRREPELAADSEDMFFDAKEYHTSNKHVATILSQSQTQAESVVQTNTAAAMLAEGDAWGDDEELDIDADEINADEDNTEAI